MGRNDQLDISSKTYSFDRKSRLFILVLIAATFVVYLPVWHAGFIWDDDAHVTQNPTLRSLDGLRRIWFELGATPQYYPLVHTSFWVEYHLWGSEPFAYHLVNVVLHALNAILVWLILRKLRIAGAWLAAMIFALHPVHVESVAWITERKNVLSGVFYLTSLLAYLHFCMPELENSSEREQVRKHYWLALVLYMCALLCKSVTCTLPAAVLLLIWWKHGRIRWRDVAPLLVFFVLGAAVGLTTIWMEQHRVGTEGAVYALSFGQRCLLAGRAFWFYAAKLFWPQNLVFFYPQWKMDTAIWWQYAFPLGVVIVMGVLWIMRNRWGRGPLVAVLFYIVSLAPALGIFSVYPFRYSFVADHFQYLASLGLIALVSAGVTIALRNASTQIAVTTPLLVVLGVLSWRRAEAFRNNEALWRDTIAKNPDCWVACNNLGTLLQQSGKPEEALEEYNRALQLNPDFAEAHYNVGNIQSDAGKLEEAIAHYERAVQIDPRYAAAYNNLGNALLKLGKTQDAIARFEQAVQFKPNMVEAHYNLANVLLDEGRIQEAIGQYEQALQINSNFTPARVRLAVARSKLSQSDKPTGR